MGGVYRRDGSESAEMLRAPRMIEALVAASSRPLNTMGNER